MLIIANAVIVIMQTDTVRLFLLKFPPVEFMTIIVILYFNYLPQLAENSLVFCAIV